MLLCIGFHLFQQVAVALCHTFIEDNPNFVRTKTVAVKKHRGQQRIIGLKQPGGEMHLMAELHGKRLIQEFHRRFVLEKARVWSQVTENFLASNRERGSKRSTGIPYCQPANPEATAASKMISDSTPALTAALM